MKDETNFHFSVKYKSVGSKLDDGTGCICLGLTDKETGITDVYPLHLVDAVNMAKELLILAFKVKRLK